MLSFPGWANWSLTDWQTRTLTYTHSLSHIFAPVFTHSLTHSLALSFNHYSLTHILAYYSKSLSLARSLFHSRIHTRTYSYSFLIHSRILTLCKSCRLATLRTHGSSQGWSNFRHRRHGTLVLIFDRYRHFLSLSFAALRSYARLWFSAPAFAHTCTC